MLVVFLFTFVHNCHNLSNKTKGDEDGGNKEPAGVKHGFVEDIGIIRASAAKQQVAKSQHHKAGNHDDIVDLTEDKVKGSVVLFVFIDFFCHDRIFDSHLVRDWLLILFYTIVS